jgi:hypothetical protein
MTIALKMPGLYMELGPGSLLQAFCATVALRLEGGLWGTRFPVLQQRLYDGRVTPADAPRLMQELDAIRAGFQQLPPDQAVCDDDTGTLQAVLTRPGPAPVDLAGFFINSGKRNLITVIRESAEYLLERGGEMTVVSYRHSPAELQGRDP